MAFAPGSKFRDRPGIGFACMWIADIRRKEFDEFPRRVGRWRKEGWELSGARDRELNRLCHAVPTGIFMYDNVLYHTCILYSVK